MGHNPLEQAVNAASVPQRSPFRYPGGKTWFVPHLMRWLCSLPSRPKQFLEPFAGGGISGLTVAFEDLADLVVMNELDEDVAAVWSVILGGGAERLAGRLESFLIKEARSFLERPRNGIEDRALATLVRNRVAHGGIMAPGAGLMKRGENGKGIASRWYPQTLAGRIRAINAVSHKIQFLSVDGIELIHKLRLDKNIAFFVDPPYTVAGRRLYRHSQIDHASLFAAMGEVLGNFIMTYDDVPEIRDLAMRYGFECKIVAMKSRQNTDKKELIIGKDLSCFPSGC